jgi:hypothetical protein
MRCVKDFARILVLTEEGFDNEELKIITELSEKTIRDTGNLLRPILSRYIRSV